MTAERRAEASQDVPISMSVFDGDFIKRNINDIFDVANFTPNFEISGHQGFGQSNFGSIRGVGAAENNISLDATSVLIYYDGIPMGAFFGSITPQWDLERIEVQRGPQGTLYGRNAVAGTVQFISAAPTDEFKGDGHVTFGEFDLRHFEGAIGGPVTEKIRTRLSAVVHERGGDVTNALLGSKLGEQEWTGFRGIVDWQLTSKFDARVKAQYMEGDMDILFFNAVPGDLLTPNAQAWLGANGLDPDMSRDSNYERIQSNVANPYDNFELTMAEVNLNYDFGPMSLTAVGGYVDGEDDFLREGPLGYKNIYEQWTGELRLTSQTEHPLQWIAGSFYQHTDSGAHLNLIADQTTSLRAPDGLNPVLPFSNIMLTRPPSIQDLDTYAFFLHTTYAWTERLKTTQAVRYTDEKNVNEFGIFPQFQIPLSPGVTITPGTEVLHIDDMLSFGRLSHAEQREQALTIISDTNLLDADGNAIPIHLEGAWDEVTWRLGIDYQFTDTALAYASISKGFKAGTFSRGNRLSSGVVDPETALVYEVGAKTRWWDDSLQFNASVFYDDHTGFQSTLIVPITPTFNLNVLENLPKVEIYGGEIEIQAVPINNLFLTANLGIVDTEITEVLPGNEALLGKSLPQSQDMSFNGLVRYDLGTGLGTFSPQVTSRYRGEYWSSKNNNDATGKLGNFWTTDFRVGYESPNASLYGIFYVRNVFDEVQPIFNISPTPGTGLSTTSKINERRNWGITMGYRF